MRHRVGFVCLLVCLAVSAGAQTDGWEERMVAGNLHDGAGEYSAALASYREAVEIVSKQGGIRLCLSLNALANVSEELGQLLQAERLYRRALALSSEHGKENLAYALSAGNLGAHYLEFGDREKAETLLRESLDLYLRLEPPDSTKLALARNSLANLVVNDGRYDEAERLIEAALVAFRKHAEPTKVQLAIGLNNLGVVRRHQNRNQEAIQLFEESVRLTETSLGSEHPTILRGLSNLATMYAEVGRCAEAERLYQQALSVGEKCLGTGHPIYARILLNYSAYLRRYGQKSLGKKLETRARTALRDSARSNGGGMTVDVSAFRH